VDGCATIESSEVPASSLAEGRHRKAHALLLFVGKIFRGAPGGSCRPDWDPPMFVRWFREGRLPLDRVVTRRYTLDQI